MDLKKLKLVQKGYETYNGPIGKFAFVNGVSVEAIHRVDRDTLATAFQFVEVDEDGTETEAGVASRLVSESANRSAAAIYAGKLKRQSTGEKEVEQTRIEAGKSKKKAEILLTRAQLEEIASKHGIKGLRAQVGDKWGVKNRSIPLLIEEILAAQAAVLQPRNDRIAKAAGAEPARVEVEKPNVTVETGADDAALLAAATGDMSAALNNQDKTDAEPDVEEPAVAPAAEPANSAPADAAGNQGADAPAGEGSKGEPGAAGQGAGGANGKLISAGGAMTIDLGTGTTTMKAD